MKRQATRPRTLVVLTGILAVIAAVWLSAASARKRKPVVVPPDAVLTWNTYTVNAVRASTPTKFQTDGMVYMSYVQAAVYDAVTKLDGRLPALPRLRVHGRPGRVGAGGGRRGSADDPRPLPARPGRRPSMPSIRPTSAPLTGNVAGRRRARPGGGERHHRAPHRRRATTRRRRATGRSGRSCPASGSCSRTRRCRRRGSRRCVRSCSRSRRSSALRRRPR